MAGLSDDVSETDDGPRDRPQVTLPATLLIVVGVLGMLVAVVNLLQHDSLPAQIDQTIADVEADPNLTREQKDEWIDALTAMKDVMTQPTVFIGYILNLIGSALVVVGGIQLLRLSGPAFPAVGSVLAMLPCTANLCCVLGLPVGVWVLVVLNRADVRAAMALRKDGE